MRAQSNLGGQQACVAGAGFNLHGDDVGVITMARPANVCVTHLMHAHGYVCCPACVVNKKLNFSTSLRPGAAIQLLPA